MTEVFRVRRENGMVCSALRMWTQEEADLGEKTTG